ncbi:toxin-antitoxin system HicB family antitoxin [Reyranella sp.]|uniref:toxin-antitoxin system HicB family antitoxin n=1 Tax=Reyranella sp. TaxID=1929291 RepID=UPI0037840E3C
MSNLTIRVPDATHARLRDLARVRGVSINKLSEEIATATLSAHEAEVRFRLIAARGNRGRALTLLDRPDSEDHSKEMVEPAGAYRPRRRGTVGSRSKRNAK